MAAYSYRNLSTLKFSILLFCFACALFSLSGCAKSDLYASCSFSSNNQNMARCSSDNASCAFEGYIACDTRICAKFKKSQSFCTVACKPENAAKTCGKDGMCVAFYTGLKQMYCVNKDVYAKASKP